MSFLSAISAAITPANQAVNAFQQGKQDRQKAQEAESLRMLDQLRKAQEAQEQGDVRKATLRNIDSQIKVREAPRTPPVARTQVLPNGQRINAQGDAEDIPGYKNPEKVGQGPAVISPGQGVRQPDGSYTVPIKAREPSSGGGDRTLVQVQGDDGVVRYVPRSEAAGMQAPSSAARGSASIKTAVSKNTEQLSVIEDALKELDANPQAVGLKRAAGDLPLMGGVADYINQRNDPKGVGARAQLANVGSLLIHDRSGAAVSVSEFPRLAPFVPRVGDMPDVIRTKLAKLKQNIEALNAELNSQMGVSGPASGRGGGGGGKTAIDQAQYDRLMKGGYSDAEIRQKYEVRP